MEQEKQQRKRKRSQSKKQERNTAKNKQRLLNHSETISRNSKESCYSLFKCLYCRSPLTPIKIYSRSLRTSISDETGSLTGDL